MVNGLNAGAHPFCAWENYETIGGTSNPGFKVVAPHVESLQGCAVINKLSHVAQCPVSKTITTDREWSVQRRPGAHQTKHNICIL